MSYRGALCPCFYLRKGDGMVYLYRSCMYCLLYFVAQVATASVVNFPNTNTIPTTLGNTAKLIGVTSINSASRTASVVIDARDKFGNKLRLFKTASFSPTKIKQYATSCIKNPVPCFAVTALTAALVYYGYTITADGRIVLPGNNGTYTQCVDKPVPIDTGGVASALGPMPCALGPNWAGVYILYTLQPMPPSEQLVQTQPLTGFYFVSDLSGKYGLYYQNFYRTQPLIDSEAQPISDDQLTDIVLENPALIQVSPGVYPDIFNPIEITETLPEESISTEPDADENQESSVEPEYEDMISMDAIPEHTVDVSTYFNWGAGWLPKSCPLPKVQSFQGQQFSFDLNFTCETIHNYVAPAVRVLAIFIFLAIVIGGSRV